MTTADTDRDRMTRYANVAGGWVGLAPAGVVVGAAGELRLHSLPDAGVPVGDDIVPTRDDSPAGCALDPCSTGYVSEPRLRVIREFSTCATESVPPGEMWGSRQDGLFLPGAFIAPRGLAIGPRRRLYVADKKAVVVTDPRTGTITGRWGDVDNGWCVTCQGDWIYVLDRGGPNHGGRVRRFTPDGGEDVAYTAAIAPRIGNAVRMATSGEVLLVVSRRQDGDAVVPLRPDGRVDQATAGAWAKPSRVERDPLTGSPVETPLATIAGIAATDGRVYLVDGEQGDLVAFTSAGGYIGTTRTTRPVVDVWSSGNTVLWTRPAEPQPMLRHNVIGAYRRTGTFVCGPLPTNTVDGRRELRARFDRVPGAHVQLWTAVTSGNVPPPPSTIPLNQTAISPIWAPVPVDVDAALVSEPSGPQLFIGGSLVSDGMSTPSVHQIGVGGPSSWIELLPALYRKDPRDSDFLDRLLRLLASVQSETTQERVDLARRFDPRTADDAVTERATGTVLEELASWLAVVLDERSPDKVRRDTVAQAFSAQAIRGSHRGLLDAIVTRFPRLKVEITELAQRAERWSLPTEDTRGVLRSAASGLGFDTMLCAAPPHGAVVGVDTIVDQSTLTAGDRPGAPLFEDLAHRFHVAALPCPGRDTTSLSTDLRALVDAEKPAHTVYTLCIAGPRARVGVQARLGVDSIIAEPHAPFDLRKPPALEESTLASSFAEHDGPGPAVVGEIRLGQGQLT